MTRARFTLSNEPSAWAVTVSRWPIRARVSSLVKGDWQVHEKRLSARACRDSLMRSETWGQERELNLVHNPLHIFFFSYNRKLPALQESSLIENKHFAKVSIAISNEHRRFAPTSFLCFSLPRPRSFCSRSNSRVALISDTKVRMRLVRPWFISSSVKRVVKATSSPLSEWTSNSTGQ